MADCSDSKPQYCNKNNKKVEGGYTQVMYKFYFYERLEHPWNSGINEVLEPIFQEYTGRTIQNSSVLKTSKGLSMEFSTCTFHLFSPVIKAKLAT